MSVRLPEDYRRYLETDGTDAAVTEGDPGYFQLWHPDEIEEMNRSYGVIEHTPGYLGFGSDGGGEMLAFDATGAVFMLPFVGMGPNEAKKIAGSWTEVTGRITERR